MQRIDSNTVIAIAALATSAIAVWVAWDESRLQRQSQSASFMPILDVSAGVSRAEEGFTATTSLRVRNVGTGVAYLERAVLRVDDAPVNDYETLAGAMFGPQLAAEADLSWQTLQGYLQPEEAIAPLVFRWRDTEDNRRRFDEYMQTDLDSIVSGFSLELCYCSVFEQCWVTASASTKRPRPVARCEDPGDPVEAIWQSYYASRASRGER